MFEKFLTKDNLVIIIVAVVMAVWFIFQSNYFSTKLEVSQLRADLLQQKIQLMEYSDKGDKEIIDKLDAKYEKIIRLITELDKKY